ncbi:hypothetical protein H0H92_005784 [Tricholoma furcatifolium]|nr:hypothetical protein H0H92_005784 [Tricholoma furcatifolium]
MVSPPAAPPLPPSFAQRAKNVADRVPEPSVSRTSASLATQALDIVAAHTASQHRSPVINVWSQRIAASRASVPNNVSGPSVGSQNNVLNSDDSIWPEVGRAEASKVKDEAASPAISPRKGAPSPGKSKWVPIPPQELQAAADALHKQQQRPRRQPPSSGSRSGSAAHSRLPSASQSQSGSLQSSPRLSRGRRLPEEKEESPLPTRPYTPSPPLVVQPHLAPTPQPIPVFNYTPVSYPYLPPPPSLWYPPIPQWAPSEPTFHNPAYPSPHNYPPRHNNYHRPHEHTRTNLLPKPITNHGHPPSILATLPNNHAQPLPPALSLPVTITPSQLPHANGRLSDMPSNPVFGTIHSDSTSPRISSSPPSNLTDAHSPRPFLQFTVGVLPGESVGPRTRSRSQTSPNHKGKRSRTATSGSEGLVGVSKSHENDGEHDANEEMQEIVDRTSPREVQWAFGSVDAGSSTSLLPSPSLQPLIPETNASSGSLSASPALNPDSSTDDPRPRELHERLEELVLRTKGAENGGEGQKETTKEEEDLNSVFQVKDYGYGFGSRGSSGNSPPQPPPVPIQPQPHINQKHGVGSGFAGPAWDRDGGRERFTKRESSRRGSGFHHHGSSMNYNQLPHQYNQEPRRRGRGASGLNGQSHGHSPRGIHRRGGSSSYSSQPHLPPGPGMFPFDPYTGAPAPMVDVNGMSPMPMNGMGLYYDRLTAAGTGYVPVPNHSSTPQAAPVPVPGPVTQLPFPLEPTRWYLLGQLEYYLSAQNMAQDYFLRSKLDSKGWVPISLIASFNRVRRLTEDEVLVKEVLSLSSVVETTDSDDGAMVRMKNWQAFVLPTAKASSVRINLQEGEASGCRYGEDEKDAGGELGRKMPVSSNVKENGGKRLEETKHDDEVADGETYDLEDDEDEDDVVFVLTRDEEVTIPWPSTGEKHA